MLSKFNKLKNSSTSIDDLLDKLTKLEPTKDSEKELIYSNIVKILEAKFITTNDPIHLIKSLNWSKKIQNIGIGKDLYNKTLCNIAIAKNMSGKYKESLIWYKKAIEEDKYNKLAWIGLINVYDQNKTRRELDQQHHETIEKCYELFPNDPEIINFKALHLWANCQSIEAIKLLEQSIPSIKDPEILCKNAMNLGFFYNTFGHTKISDHWFDVSMKADKNHLITYENILLNSLYSISMSPQDVTDLHIKYSEKFKRKNNECTVPIQYTNSKYSGLKGGLKKIAIISGDFGEHAVSCFTQFFYISTKIEYHFLSNTTEDLSHITEKVGDGRVHIIHQLSVKDVGLLLTNLKIDTIIDLSGYTAKNRMDIMANITCKNKYTFCGYPADLGFSDVRRISDEFTEINNKPENVVKLPRLFCCYSSRINLEPHHIKITDFEDYFIFGCLGKLQKINDSVVDAWLNILDGCKSKGLKAALLLKSNYISEQWCPILTQRPDVIIVKSTPDHVSHMGYYNFLDLSLDTWPYNGTTITCESLYMNVPVLTFCDKRANHVGRVSGTILKEMGLNEYIVESIDNYITKAIDIVEYQMIDESYISIEKVSLRTKLLEIMEPYKFVDEFDDLMISCDLDSN